MLSLFGGFCLCLEVDQQLGIVFAFCFLHICSYSCSGFDMLDGL